MGNRTLLSCITQKYTSPQASCLLLLVDYKANADLKAYGHLCYFDGLAAISIMTAATSGAARRSLWVEQQCNALQFQNSNPFCMPLGCNLYHCYKIVNSTCLCSLCGLFSGYIVTSHASFSSHIALCCDAPFSAYLQHFSHEFLQVIILTCP